MPFLRWVIRRQEYYDVYLCTHAGAETRRSCAVCQRKNSTISRIVVLGPVTMMRLVGLAMVGRPWHTDTGSRSAATGAMTSSASPPSCPRLGPYRTNAQHRYVTKTGRRRRLSIDGCTSCYLGYAVNQRRRELVEEAFAWIKTIASQAKTRPRGTPARRLTIPARERSPTS